MFIAVNLARSLTYPFYVVEESTVRPQRTAPDHVSLRRSSKQPEVAGLVNGLGAIDDAELTHDVAQVRLDSLF